MRAARYTTTICLLVATLSPASARADDVRALGGNLTSDLPLNVVLELPAPTVTDPERRKDHLEGHNDFHKSFEGVEQNGKPVLGPRFNHNGCGSCHVHDGRGRAQFSDRPPGSEMLVKVSLKGLADDGSPRPVPGVGEQLLDHGPKGATYFNIKLAWKKFRGSYDDKTRYVLRKPQLSFTIPGMKKSRIVTSLRMSPPVIGMGLLESIPDDVLLALADPDDSDGDGISGKVNLVTNHETGAKAIGRFGFRASNPTIRQQTAGAFVNDMGMTNEIFNPTKSEAEVSSEVFARIVFYQQAAGLPPARDQDEPDVVAGRQLFQQLGCDDCHRMTLRTGSGVVPEVADQEFHPFTDLLLHDMGPGLADNRPEFLASGREWRTTPLWGLGLIGIVSTTKPAFLHDGRARTLEEAILWHAGEAKRSSDAFKALSKLQRDQLVRFLHSL